MAIFDSISSISNPTKSINSSISTLSSFGKNIGNNSVACFDGGFDGCMGGGGCCISGGRNINIINVDIDIGRRHHRRCC
ncbi:hypothetical protein ACTFIT_002696 [Dictyostelium discoideum]